jgi:hypothetical protein
MPLRIVLFVAVAAAQVWAQPPQQPMAPLARLRSNIERITRSGNYILDLPYQKEHT